MKMNPIVHFEMPAEDRQRMADFYSKTFGWEMEHLGPQMADYILVKTSESDEKGPKERARINGGFFQKTIGNPMKHPSLVVAVDDIKESMKKVEEGGGKVHGEPIEIPGVGHYVMFTDTEGNFMSMMQPTGKM